MLSNISRFMEFREWYSTPHEDGLEEPFYPDGRGYHLKERAPEEARLAYEEMYDPEELVDVFQPDSARILCFDEGGA